MYVILFVLPYLKQQLISRYSEQFKNYMLIYDSEVNYKILNIGYGMRRIYFLFTGTDKRVWLVKKEKQMKN